MKKQSKSLIALKKVRARRDENWKRKQFCLEHKMVLEGKLYEALEKEMMRVERILEEVFGLDTLPFED
jgi:hypothetical protein